MFRGVSNCATNRSKLEIMKIKADGKSSLRTAAANRKCRASDAARVNLGMSFSENLLDLCVQLMIRVLRLIEIFFAALHGCQPNVQL